MLAANNFGTQNLAYAWADFLMGNFDDFYIQGKENDFRYPSWYFFLQDEWKATSRLTLNLGLRYELYGALNEVEDRMGASFIPGHVSDQFPTSPPGRAFNGDRGVPSGIMPQDNNNIAPRFGFAYDPTGSGKTSIRGAIGLYYSAIPLAVRGQLGPGYGAPSPAGTNGNLSDPYGTSKWNPYDTAFRYGSHNPVPDAMKSLRPANYPWSSGYSTQNVRGVPTLIYGGIVGFDETLQTPFVTQWNLSLERELSKGIKVDAGYIGNRGNHLPLWMNLNSPIPMPGANNSAQSALDRRPLSQYGDVRIYQTRLNSSYHSFQTGLVMRLGSEMTGQFNYVYAKDRTPFGVNATGAGSANSSGFSSGAGGAESIFDTGNAAGQTSYPYDINRDYAQNGRTHTFKANAVHDLPWFGDRTSWLYRIAGGWTISGTFMATSGLPLNVIWGQDANVDGNGFDRPNVIGPIEMPGRHAGERPHPLPHEVCLRRSLRHDELRRCLHRDGRPAAQCYPRRPAVQREHRAAEELQLHGALPLPGQT